MKQTSAHLELERVQQGEWHVLHSLGQPMARDPPFTVQEERESRLSPTPAPANRAGVRPQANSLHTCIPQDRFKFVPWHPWGNALPGEPQSLCLCRVTEMNHPFICKRLTKKVVNIPTAQNFHRPPYVCHVNMVTYLTNNSQNWLQLTKLQR